jgi:cytochrome c5
MHIRPLILVAIIATCAALPRTLAGDPGTDTWKLPAETATFKSGPGADLVTASCRVCHSADYIATQPPMNRTQWTALVNKMKAKFGAPLMTNKVDEIVDYLVRNYGSEHHD